MSEHILYRFPPYGTTCRRNGRRHGTLVVAGVACIFFSMAGPTRGETPAESDQPSAISNESLPTAAARATGDAEIIQRKPAKSASSNRPTAPVSSFGGWVRMLQPVVIVFGVMAVLTWAGRKWLPQAKAASTAQSVIRVLARQHLSSKQSLCLVKLGPKVVLLGVTPEHIGSVLEIRDPDEAASLVAAVESTRGRSFTRAMAAFSAPPERDVADEPLSPTPVKGDANEQIRDMVRRVRAMGMTSHSRTAVRPGGPVSHTG